nr:immunoglobulin light chain junction region [Macaca mulatta]MOW40321.1 immunoglobulin light chain junction region [Macaca mulatta]
CQQGYINPYSF